jgi:hypothetical protein
MSGGAHGDGYELIHGIDLRDFGRSKARATLLIISCIMPAIVALGLHLDYLSATFFANETDQGEQPNRTEVSSTRRRRP